MKKKKFINCGFDKWKIGFDPKNSCVEIKGGHWPIDFHVKLYDISKDELLALSELFKQVAECEYED